MFVSVIIVRGLLGELTRRGIDPDLLLEGMNIEPAYLLDMRNMVDAQKFAEIVGRAMELTGDPGIGLTLGANAPEHMTQLLGHLVLSASTPLEAFELYRRYSSLIVDDLRLSLDMRGDIVKFGFGYHGAVTDDVSRFGAEVTAIVVIRVMRAFLAQPNACAREIGFKHEAPSYATRYSHICQCPVRFGQVENFLLADAAIMKSSQRHADVTTMSILSTAAQNLLDESPKRLTVAGRLIARLRFERDLCSVDTARLAREFGLTPRTLRRRLKAEGANLSQVLSEARLRVAREELARPGASIRDIAERIGYSEMSSFYRAFKRSAGMTPKEYLDSIEERSTSR